MLSVFLRFAQFRGVVPGQAGGVYVDFIHAGLPCPQVFTIEFDVFVANDKNEDDNIGDHTIELALGNPDVDNHNGGIAWFTFWQRSDGGAALYWEVQKPSGDSTGGEKYMNFDEETPLVEGWKHLAFSFNKRALKGYVNGLRIINIPNAKVASHFWITHSGVHKYGCVSNVRVAKRAEAIVNALADQGIARSRLTPVGKGSHNPIASNSTDEGRAKNRRVEFVKK